jgi:peptidoglycan/xylan/chitin deacetylase (PgdA/CDA1 family)
MLAQLKRRVTRMLLGPGPAILMYHRIAEPEVDPWSICVSPARLREQMRAIRPRRTVLAMDEFVARLQSGELPRNAIAVTFDDGYLDNLRTAKPILEEEGVPATIFLSTGVLGSGEVWSDELSRMILARREAASATVTIAGETVAIAFAAMEDAAPTSTGWRGWEPPGSDRERVYRRLWEIIQPLEPPEQKLAMVELRKAMGPSGGKPDAVLMASEDVAELVSPLISVGGHGVSHQPLPALPPERRAAAVNDNLVQCEALAQRPIEGFAYPYGAMDDDTKELLRQSGFRWACTTQHGVVDRRRADLYALPRIGVGDWTADVLLRVLDGVV